jgi:hypothetical protein
MRGGGGSGIFAPQASGIPLLPSCELNLTITLPLTSYSHLIYVYVLGQYRGGLRSGWPSNRGSIPGSVRDISLLCSVQTSSVADSASH